MRQTTNTPQPQTGKAAIYARVNEVAKATPHPHIATLVQIASERGYHADNITVYEHTCTSGRIPDAEREAFAALIAAITTPEPDQAPIRAIFVSSEERLFRSASMQDIVRFVQTCLEHNVTLVTPTAEYDFTNQNHVIQFCFACQTADQSIGQVTSDRLQTGKRAAAARRKAQSRNQ